MSIIPISECKVGHLYWLHARNITLAVFEGTVYNRFIGIRTKFKSRFLDAEDHFENGPPHGTARPYLDLGPIPEGILIAVCMPHKWVMIEDEYRRVNRRDLRNGEDPHGRRKGFVDEWHDNGERLPDDTYPFLRNNKELFEFLDKYELSPEDAATIEKIQNVIFPWQTEDRCHRKEGE